MTKRLKRPRDPIALAKMIGDIATGAVEDMRSIFRDGNRLPYTGALRQM